MRRNWTSLDEHTSHTVRLDHIEVYMSVSLTLQDYSHKSKAKDIYIPTFFAGTGCRSAVVCLDVDLRVGAVL